MVCADAAATRERLIQKVVLTHGNCYIFLVDSLWIVLLAMSRNALKGAELWEAIMKRSVGRRLFGAALASGLLAAGTAVAGGSGMPWEGPIQQVVQSITGPVVQAAAVIAVVLFGAGVAMSESGSSMRRALGILFGLTIAFAASTFFLDFFGFAGGVEIA